MRRVAIVAPQDSLRAVLVRVADVGCVEFDTAAESVRAGTGPAGRRLRRLRAEPGSALLSPVPPDLDALERDGRGDLLAGEAQLEERAGQAVRRGSAAALAAWCPADRLPELTAELARVGGTAVVLRRPRGLDPPTLLRRSGELRASMEPLVRTYGTVPYRDIDPTWPAGVAYVVMFGMMFGDAGHGALLLLFALLLRAGRPRRLAPLHRLWPFVAAAGAASCAGGLAYGEFFGPTGVLPVLWLAPLDQPVRLLAVGVGVGAALLAFAYAAGTVNRWREGGPARALYAASGLAGSAVFLGFGLLAGWVWLGGTGLALAGAVLCTAGLVLAGIGLRAETAGGATGALQTGIQLFDVVVRIGSNTVSFARLAAFGLTHAALGGIVWQGTTALTGKGAVGAVAGAAVFVLGNALTFALEALVAGVQALRLTFYELFSRLFEAEGRPFAPWHVPTERTERMEVAP
jgi:V/A-type H+-transporting ATPase subunit I